MTGHLLNTTLGFLALAALPFLALGGPAVGGETAQTRIAWSGADPKTEEIVKWVYEGCAAYPVTRADLEAAEAWSKQEPDLMSRASPSFPDVDKVDHAARR